MAGTGTVYRFRPVLKERPWGGHRLATLLGRRAPVEKRFGESWELFSFGDAASELARPTPNRRTLRDLIVHGDVRVDANGQPAGTFPLLFKWLDADSNLSVQVHPPDGHPLLPAGQFGKTECWVVLAAEPGSKVFVGLKQNCCSGELLELARSGEIAGYLQDYDVKPGDAFFIPAGTVHALGAGVTVAEVQQASDVTFRLYDWNRIDPATGRPRELHLEQAVACTCHGGGKRVEPIPSLVTEAIRVERLLGAGECHAFELHRIRAGSAATVRLTGNWLVWMVLDGETVLSTGRSVELLTRGDTVLVTGPGEYLLQPAPEGVTLLQTTPAASCTPYWAAR